MLGDRTGKDNEWPVGVWPEICYGWMLEITWYYDQLSFIRTILSQRREEQR